jgi:hypothetical protein
MKEEDVLPSGLLKAVRADGRESVELLLRVVERNVACDVIRIIDVRGVRDMATTRER